MPGQQVPCSIRIHAQCDVEEQRLLLQAAQRAGNQLDSVTKWRCKSGNKAPNLIKVSRRADNKAPIVKIRTSVLK